MFLIPSDFGMSCNFANLVRFQNLTTLMCLFQSEDSQSIIFISLGMHAKSYNSLEGMTYWYLFRFITVYNMQKTKSNKTFWKIKATVCGFCFHPIFAIKMSIDFPKLCPFHKTSVNFIISVQELISSHWLR